MYAIMNKLKSEPLSEWALRIVKEHPEFLERGKGGKMKTIDILDEIDRRILDLKKDDKYIRLSYAEVVRQLLERGLEADGNGE